MVLITNSEAVFSKCQGMISNCYSTDDGDYTAVEVTVRSPLQIQTVNVSLATGIL